MRGGGGGASTLCNTFLNDVGTSLANLFLRTDPSPPCVFSPGPQKAATSPTPQTHLNTGAAGSQAFHRAGTRGAGFTQTVYYKYSAQRKTFS